MPEYRVEFPDGEAWTINVTGKKGKQALEAAHQRAASARAAQGQDPSPYEDCKTQKMTPQLRAALKGLTYLTSAQLLATCTTIGNSYQSQGMSLTVRGMYYQLVSKGFLPSGQTEYNRVKNLLAAARLKGDFPLGLLSDSSRTLHPGNATRYDLDIDRTIALADDWVHNLDRFFLQIGRWYRQPDLPIVLFEKEALSNVFGPLCNKLGVAWMATKGYPSVSTLFSLHQMMVRASDHDIQTYGTLEHLGYDFLENLDPKNRGRGSMISSPNIRMPSTTSPRTWTWMVTGRMTIRKMATFENTTKGSSTAMVMETSPRPSGTRARIRPSGSSTSGTMTRTAWKSPSTSNDASVSSR